MIDKALEALNLTKQERAVYLATLRIGRGTVQDIAEQAGTYRTYTYEILAILARKGMVSCTVRNRAKHFEATPPDQLLEIARERWKTIEKALPALRQITTPISHAPNVTFYEGKDGLKAVFEDFLKEGKDLLVYGNSSKTIKTLGPFFSEYIKRRTHKGMRTKVLTEYSTTGKRMQASDKKELRETRFIPTDSSTSTFIYGNKVAIISFDNEVVAIMIESKNVAHMQREVFEMLWKHSRA